MSVQAASQINGNPASGAGTYFRPTPFDQGATVSGPPPEINSQTAGSAQEPEAASPSRQVAAVFSQAQAFDMAAKTAETITDYPAKILNRIHQPNCPSLLGKSYV